MGDALSKPCDEEVVDGEADALPAHQRPPPPGEQTLPARRVVKVRAGVSRVGSRHSKCRCCCLTCGSPCRPLSPSRSPAPHRTPKPSPQLTPARLKPSGNAAPVPPQPQQALLQLPSVGSKRKAGTPAEGDGGEAAAKRYQMLGLTLCTMSLLQVGGMQMDVSAAGLCP